MKVLILSDIHANEEALDAVLTEAPPTNYDQLLILGDLVGYGASPNEVVDRVFALDPDVLIRGNHDKAASGVEEPDTFNEVAAAAALWTRETLTESNRARVAALPRGPAFSGEDIEVCHGTPFDEDVYVFDRSIAMRALSSAQRRVCFFGHTHLPVAYALRQPSTLEVIVPELGDTAPSMVPLDGELQYLINPGAVGQPRDGDPRASYGVLDTESHTVELRRVPYRIDFAQEKILAAGLPTPLARRLGVGR